MEDMIKRPQRPEKSHARNKGFNKDNTETCQKNTLTNSMNRQSTQKHTRHAPK